MLYLIAIFSHIFKIAHILYIYSLVLCLFVQCKYSMYWIELYRITGRSSRAYVVVFLMFRSQRSSLATCWRRENGPWKVGTRYVWEFKLSCLYQCFIQNIWKTWNNWMNWCKCRYFQNYISKQLCEFVLTCLNTLCSHWWTRGGWWLMNLMNDLPVHHFVKF